jgi:Ty3 transposon capsid-like protein
MVPERNNTNSNEILFPLGRDSEGQVRSPILRKRLSVKSHNPPVIRHIPKTSQWATRWAQQAESMEVSRAPPSPKAVEPVNELEDIPPLSLEEVSPPKAQINGKDVSQPASVGSEYLKIRRLQHSIINPLSISDVKDEPVFTKADVMQLFERQFQRQDERMTKFEDVLLKLKAAPTPTPVGRQIKLKDPPSWISSKKSGDIHHWLDKVIAYVETDVSASDERKVVTAASYLEGPALEYWSSRKAFLKESNTLITFKTFQDALLGQYSEAFRQENAAENLCTLRESKGNLRLYKSTFEDLLSRLPTDSAQKIEYLLIALYRKGLHPTTAAGCAVNPQDGSKHTNFEQLKTASILAADTVTAQETATKQLQASTNPRDFPVKRKSPDEGKAPKKKLAQCHNCKAYGHTKEVCRKPVRGFHPPPPTAAGRGQNPEPPRKQQFPGNGKPRR